MDAIPGGPHTIFDVLWGIVTAAVGFIVKNERDERKTLAVKVGEIERSFVSRADLERVQLGIDGKLERIEDKLDRVMERRYPDSFR